MTAPDGGAGAFGTPPRRPLPGWVIPVIVAGSIVVVAVVVVVALVLASVLGRAASGSSSGSSAAGAGPRNMASFGVQLVGKGGQITALATDAAGSTPAKAAATPSGAKAVVEYLDLSCPACKAFEANTLDWSLSQVAAGKLTLELRPIAILDRSYQGSNYSTRINAAAACVADRQPEGFLSFAEAAYARQPAETSSGLTDAQIVSLAHDAGITDSAVDSCITKQTFAAWVDAATTSASNTGKIPVGTPTIYVNGTYYDAKDFSLASFQSFVAGA